MFGQKPTNFWVFILASSPPPPPPPGGKRLLKVPEAFKLNPEYGMFPHQVPSTAQLLKRAFGPLGGCLLADDIRLGKTNMVLGTFSINFIAGLKPFAPSAYKGDFLSIAEDGTAHGPVLLYVGFYITYSTPKHVGQPNILTRPSHTISKTSALRLTSAKSWLGTRHVKKQTSVARTTNAGK